jgi:hypothetical protein
MKGHLYFSKPLPFLLFCGIESQQRVSVGFDVDLSFGSILALKNALTKILLKKDKST